MVALPPKNTPQATAPAVAPPAATPTPATATTAAPAASTTQDNGQQQDDGGMGFIGKLFMALLSGDWGALFSLLTGGGLGGDDNGTSVAGAGSQGASATVAQSANLAPIENVNAKAATSLVQTEVTSGILSSMGNVTEATQMAAIQGVSFSDGKGGYATGDGAVNEESIKQVSITGADGQTHYYKRIGAVDGVNGTTTGLKATAFVETDKDGKAFTDKDGKPELLLGFSGYTGDVKDGSAQTMALNDVIEGKLNPQALEAAAFTDKMIQQMGGKDKISGVIFGAHSMGASNALAAQVVSDLEGVKSETTLLIEPAGASLEARKIKEALADGNSGFSQTLQGILKDNKLATDQDAASKVSAEVATFQQDIDSKTVSIRTYKESGYGREGTIVSTLQPEMGPAGQRMETGMAIAKKEQMMKMLGMGKKEDVTLDNNPDNAMLGVKVFQNMTGDNNIVAGGSQMAQLDPNHQLANIINGELNLKNQILNAGRTLNESNVAGGLNTQGPGNTAPVVVAANQQTPSTTKIL